MRLPPDCPADQLIGAHTTDELLAGWVSLGVPSEDRGECRPSRLGWCVAPIGGDWACKVLANEVAAWCSRQCDSPALALYRGRRRYPRAPKRAVMSPRRALSSQAMTQVLGRRHKFCAASAHRAERGAEPKFCPLASSVPPGSGWPGRFGSSCLRTWFQCWPWFSSKCHRWRFSRRSRHPFGRDFSDLFVARDCRLIRQRGTSRRGYHTVHAD